MNRSLRWRQELASGQRLIYIANRLFDLSDKLASSHLERAVFQGVREGLEKLELKLTKYPIYLPFRDTSEDEMMGRDDLFYAIYEEDIKRLDRLYGLVGFLNDPSKDDGVCMEFGYAYARSAATIAIVTDIQHYSMGFAGETEFLLDPILERMIGKLVYRPQLPSGSKTPSDGLRAMRSFARDYEVRLLNAERHLLSEVRKLSHDAITTPNRFRRTLPKAPPRTDVFVDFLGGRDEWAREYAKETVSTLKQVGFTANYSTRFDPTVWNASNYPRSQELGERDIVGTLGADILVVGADGPETDGGAAALVGMARALGKHIVLYYSGSTRIVEGSAMCRRNLMLECSADRVVSSLREIVSYVTESLGNGREIRRGAEKVPGI